MKKITDSTTTSANNVNRPPTFFMSSGTPLS
jgi:hypothetical protein